MLIEIPKDVRNLIAGYINQKAQAEREVKQIIKTILACNNQPDQNTKVNLEKWTIEVEDKKDEKLGDDKPAGNEI